MTTTLVLSDDITRVVGEVARRPVETAGVLLCSLMKAPNGDIRLLGRSMHWVPSDAYLAQKSDHLAIASHGYVHALAEAERLHAVPFWFHTHPTELGRPIASTADRKVDGEIADLFRLRSASEYYGTLIVSPRPNGLAFTGALSPDTGEPIRVDRLWCVGDGWQLYQSFDSSHVEMPAIFDRSVRAFGPAIQSTLGDLRVGIVGCGGTGSALAEQLVRLGVRHLMLIDADTLTASNVTRVYGSTPADVGRPKVELQRDHLKAIAHDLTCSIHRSMVTLQSTARELASCDIVFGCTDDNAGRLVLSRLSTFLLTPVIDVGILLTSDQDGELKGIDGRVTILSPGAACLVCRDRVDLARAAIELRSPDERRRLEDEGYAPALAGIEPAVVSFTSAVASAAINELLERLIGYGPAPRPNEVLMRWHEREISSNIATPRPGHYCDPVANKIGIGGGEPFLEQSWSEA